MDPSPSAVNVIDVQKGWHAPASLTAPPTDLGIHGGLDVLNSIILRSFRGHQPGGPHLRVIDVSTSAELKIKVFPLKNADATETAKTLNDVFKRETRSGDRQCQPACRTSGGCSGRGGVAADGRRGEAAGRAVPQGARVRDGPHHGEVRTTRSS